MVCFNMYIHHNYYLRVKGNDNNDDIPFRNGSFFMGQYFPEFYEKTSTP